MDYRSQPKQNQKNNRICTSMLCLASFGDIFCTFNLCIGLVTFSISLMTILTHGEVVHEFGAIIYYYGVYGVLFASLSTIFLSIIGLCGMSTSNRFFLIVLILGTIFLGVLLFVSLFLVLVFPYAYEEKFKAVMLDYMQTRYGTFSISTIAWDYMQSYLLCCAVNDRGWGQFRNSQWFENANTLPYLASETILVSNPEFIMVPKTCCVRKLDYLTGRLTDNYEDLFQCQSWQYGPPRFDGGAHNDALYYRGCFSTLRAYIQRFSVLIAIFGAGQLLSLIITIILAGSLLKRIR